MRRVSVTTRRIHPGDVQSYFGTYAHLQSSARPSLTPDWCVLRVVTTFNGGSYI